MYWLRLEGVKSCTPWQLYSERRWPGTSQGSTRRYRPANAATGSWICQHRTRKIDGRTPVNRHSFLQKISSLGRLLPRRSFWSFEIFSCFLLSVFYFLFSILLIVLLFWSQSRSTLSSRGCVWQRASILPWPCEGWRRWEMYNRQSRTAGSWSWVRTNCKKIAARQWWWETGHHPARKGIHTWQTDWSKTGRLL